MAVETKEKILKHSGPLLGFILCYLHHITCYCGSALSFESEVSDVMHYNITCLLIKFVIIYIIVTKNN